MQHRLIVVFILAAQLLTGCATTIDSIEQKKILSAIDFSAYSDSGFLFTPHGYNEKFKSIGLLSVTLMPSANYEEVFTGGKNSEGQPAKKMVWSVSKIYTEDAIDSVYRIAKKMGADAIIDFKIESALERYNEGTLKQVQINGLKITGFAIRRIN